MWRLACDGVGLGADAKGFADIEVAESGESFSSEFSTQTTMAVYEDVGILVREEAD